MDKIRDLREKYFQVDDEYLNGYARLCGIHATGVYLSMCRHADKEQRCFPSKKLIAEELAISERSVYSAIKTLEQWNIIFVEEQGKKSNGTFKVKIYTLLDKKKWKPKPQANGAVGKDCTPPQANDDIDRRQQVPNKETHILTKHIEKETHISELSSQVNKIMKIFATINPTLNWGNKTTRGAAEWLIKKYGLNGTVTMAEQIVAVQGQPYAPVATTPYQMKEKLAQFKIHFDGKRNNKSNFVQL